MALQIMRYRAGPIGAVFDTVSTPGPGPYRELHASAARLKAVAQTTAPPIPITDYLITDY